MYIAAMELYFSWIQMAVLSDTGVAAMNTGVATMSSLAQYRVEVPRSRGNVDATTWGWLRVETPEASSYSWYVPTEQLTNWEQFRRAPEWIWIFKGPAEF